MSGATVERKCKRCEATFTARTADVKRGWALFCSKSCKASTQEARTGQYAAHLRGKESMSCPARDAMEDGWDGHKEAC